jgi:hypothetical protein
LSEELPTPINAPYAGHNQHGQDQFFGGCRFGGAKQGGRFDRMNNQLC